MQNFREFLYTLKNEIYVQRFTEAWKYTWKHGIQDETEFAQS